MPCCTIWPDRRLTNDPRGPGAPETQLDDTLGAECLSAVYRAGVKGACPQDGATEASRVERYTRTGAPRGPCQLDEGVMARIEEAPTAS
jgi:hypothetical protein